jgi:hypothetical protein
MSSSPKEEVSNYNIAQLCCSLEWHHRKAYGTPLDSDRVDLGDDRKSLDELAFLQKFEKDIVITEHCRQWQFWYTVYYKSIILFTAFVDYEGFNWKSSWNKGPLYDACVRQLCINSEQQ